jgi:hypothetical protein
MDEYPVIDPRIAAQYSDFFDNFESTDLEKLLSGISSEDLVQTLSTIYIQLNNSNKYDEAEFALTNKFVSYFPWDIRKYIYSVLNKIKDEQEITPLVFTPLSYLYIIQYSLLNYQEYKGYKFDINSEINIFKAFLYINEVYSKKKNSCMVFDKKIDKDERLLETYIPSCIPHLELQEQKDLRVQSIKLKYFFDFVEKDKTFSKYRDHFYELKKVNNFKEYLRYIFLLYSTLYKSDNGLTNNQTQCIIKIDKNTFQKDYEFTENLAVKINAIELKSELITDYQIDDLKLLRKYPIIHTKKDEFLVPNVDFLADKIFQVLQFDFANIAENVDGLKYGKGYKTYYSDNFSHKMLFHPTMKYCFHNNTEIFKEGDLTDEEYSDFYIRNGKNIFIFEFKDHIMNSEIKHSYSYEKVRKDLFDTFVGTKEKHKAILQLINVMNSIQKGGFAFDKFIDNNQSVQNLIIQPIIVYTDCSYGCAGVNYILNKEFKKILGGYTFDFNVNDIVMINLDTFVKYQDIFHDNKISFEEALIKYRSYILKYIEENKTAEKLVDYAFIDFNTFFVKEILMKEININPENPRKFKEISKEILSK